LTGNRPSTNNQRDGGMQRNQRHGGAAPSSVAALAQPDTYNLSQATTWWWLKRPKA
jgi:hypothetical protein